MGQIDRVRQREAARLLREAGDSAKLAIVMAQPNLPVRGARRRGKSSSRSLRAVLG